MRFTAKQVFLWAVPMSIALAGLLACGGCPATDDQGTQDLPADGQATVVLSAEEIAGPGGLLIYQGEEITGNVTVPENALLGAVKDGEVYLYHPALGSDELSEYNSRRAVGYFLMGLTAPSKAPTLAMKDALAIGGSTTMLTGVRVERESGLQCKVENLAARFVALKTDFSASNATHAFLPAAELEVPVTILGMIDRAMAGGIFNPTCVRTINTPEMAIESYGAVVRGYPSLACPGSEEYHGEVFRGIAEALIHDPELFSRVNALDFTYSAFEGVKNLGRVVSPFECVDLVVPEVLIGSTEIVAVGLLEADPQVMKQIVLDYMKNLINSLVTCAVELALGEITNPAGWAAMAVNTFSDILAGGKWVFDVPLAGGVDVLRYPPFDRLEMARPVLPKSISGEGTLQDEGETFSLITEPAVLTQGANISVEYTWMPQQDFECDPDYVPWASSIYVETLAGGWYLTDAIITTTTPDSPDGKPRTWTLEETTYGSGLHSTGTIEVHVNWDAMPVFFGFDAYPESGPPCVGHFRVNATIEYAPAEQ